MNTKTSTEAQRVFVDLAIAVANALAHPACPRELADVLSEAVNPIADLVAPATPNAVNIAILRGLVAAAVGESGDATRPDPASPDLPMGTCAGDRRQSSPEPALIETM